MRQHALSDNKRLPGVRALEQQLAQCDNGPTIAFNAKHRERLLTLGRDLSRVWDEAGASMVTRKTIVRLLICDIIVDVVGNKVELVTHCHGGDHTRLTAKRNRVGQNQWVTDAMPAQHLCKGAPWIIRARDLERKNVFAENNPLTSRRALEICRGSDEKCG